MKNNLIYYFDRVIDKLLFSIRNIFKTNKGSIILLDYTPYSGSNVYALYKYINSQGYNNAELIEFKNINVSKLGFKKYIKVVKKILEAEVVITTHDIIFYKDKQHLIQLWHGIPLKTMGLMDKSLSINDKDYVIKSYNKYEYVISTSEMYNTLLNACTGYKKGNYYIAGLPRNDYLYKEGKLNNLYDLKKFEKIIMFIPTFRKGYVDREEGNDRYNNIFGFDSFNFNEFITFLEENNYLFIAKLHPYEEQYYKHIYKNIKSDNFIFLSSDELKDKKIDLYEILPDADMLITDYSSVYFDYLLTDKPIIFVSSDIDTYENNRGFLLSPFSFWTPGSKVKDQNQLQYEIVDNFELDKFKEHRQTVRNIMFKHQDDKACERIWNIIKNIQG